MISLIFDKPRKQVRLQSQFQQVNMTRDPGINAPEWMPSVAIAGSILLKQRSRFMNGVQLMLMKYSGFQSMSSYLSAMKIGTSLKYFNKKCDEFKEVSHERLLAEKKDDKKALSYQLLATALPSITVETGPWQVYHMSNGESSVHAVTLLDGKPSGDTGLSNIVASIPIIPEPLVAIESSDINIMDSQRIPDPESVTIATENRGRASLTDQPVLSTGSHYVIDNFYIFQKVRNMTGPPEQRFPLDKSQQDFQQSLIHQSCK